jgi:hypothetical protein
MDAFFAPSTRFRDRYNDQYRDQYRERQEDFNDLVEVELTQGCVAGEILLHRGFTWKDFYSVANGKIVWINPDVFFDLSLIGTRYQRDYRRFLTVSAGGLESNEVVDMGVFEVGVYASSIAFSTMACSILLQLLATCQSRKITLVTGDDSYDFPVSAIAFSHFLMQSSRSLKVLCMWRIRLNEYHCHAIDASTRTDLQINLGMSCELTELGEIVLLGSIRQNRGPTGLHRVNVNARRLADALRGSSRVTIFTPLLGRTSEEDCHAFFQALAENEGLVTLDLSRVSISDENWDVLWQSVSRHPKLENIDMDTTNRGLADVEKTRRTHAIVDALRVNTVLHTIRLCRNNCDLEILHNMVRPHLLVNMYRPRAAAIATIAEERGIWQRKILGRALASVSSNPCPDPIWMIVSGNANVICCHPPQE